MDGKSKAWRDAADKLLHSLAIENRYIVADMVIMLLESAGYGLHSYEPLGGVFKRAATKGVIKKVPRRTKNALWVSNVHNGDSLSQTFIPDEQPLIYEGQIIRLKGFGADGNFRVVATDGKNMSLEAVK